MTRLSALIVDDEPPARKRMRTMLGELALVDVVGEATNGHDAIDLTGRLRPDILFLDINMPGLDGISTLRGLGHEHRPTVVLTTAYIEFAVDAFELDVADYLVKPFALDRLAAACDRARRHLGYRSAPDDGWIVVREVGELFRLRTEDVIAVEAEGNYVRLVTAERGFLTRSTLRATEAKLRNRGFVAAGRSRLINVGHIVRLTIERHGDATAWLSNGSTLRISRTHRRGVEAGMNAAS